MRNIEGYTIITNYLLTLKNGERLNANLIKDDDGVTEKVFKKGDRLIFECEIIKYKISEVFVESKTQKKESRMKRLLFITGLLLLSLIIQAQDTITTYKRFPSSDPYWFRLYEQEIKIENQIERIDSFVVWKYLNVAWMQGHYAYEGDTTKLIFSGWQRENDPKNALDSIWYPTYIYYDTVHVKPSVQGFKEWKKEKGYK